MLTTISNKKFTISLNDKGYYELFIKAGEEVFVEDVQLIKDSQKQLSGKRLPILISGGQFSITNIETLKYIAKNENMPYSKVSAYVAESIPQKILGNFYLKIYKPERPTHFFYHKADAVEWLKQYL